MYKSSTIYSIEEMSRKNVFKSYAICGGRESTDDDSRPESSLKVCIEESFQKMAEILRNFHFTSTRLIDNLTENLKSTLYLILTENLDEQVCLRFVSHTLRYKARTMDDQNDCRVEHCRDLQSFRYGYLLSSIVARDVTVWAPFIGTLNLHTGLKQEKPRQHQRVWLYGALNSTKHRGQQSPGNMEQPEKRQKIFNKLRDMKSHPNYSQNPINLLVQLFEDLTALDLPIEWCGYLITSKTISFFHNTVQNNENTVSYSLGGDFGRTQPIADGGADTHQSCVHTLRWRHSDRPTY
ncbi:hypothetical protein J437_LFUL001407 [Ladona fulva]|uniref:Uncharacterized protein n=1 Tax=Ladona fulva TaxID=123851 RepID=A0A8K0JWQ7_LADFU|nr:hypothetical protein J437_LFUL001407 [Ladona fulva]